MNYRITMRVTVAANTEDVLDFAKDLATKNFGMVSSVRVSPERGKSLD